MKKINFLKLNIITNKSIVKSFEIKNKYHRNALKLL